ncbi:MAG: glycyl-radical enzyme activating protein [Clostridiales bacterium]|jgi:pyruvate formate lyase activating enzyme|nr:glycyl-radical enzyme activating protein [Clostridiales bacterium]
MIRGMIFNIQRFSIHDGPGIRTAVFMKGCPLRCEWCHNPEGQRNRLELSFILHKCVGCGRCIEVCPAGAHAVKPNASAFEGEQPFTHTLDRNKCIVCGKCAEACAYGALSVAGKLYTPEEVIAEVLRDMPFYKNSGGGVTFTGGEPFAQHEFLLEMLKLSKSEGLHVCIETSLFAPTDMLLEAAAYTDLFLADYKESNDDLHKKFTGVSNKTIIDNFRAIDAAGAKIELRCPLIPDRNDREEHYRGIADLANSLSNVVEITLEPYHPLGTSKCENFGYDCKYDRREFMDKADAEKAAEFIRSLTNTKVRVQ